MSSPEEDKTVAGPSRTLEETPSSTSEEAPPRKLDDIISSIIEILLNYQKNVDETIKTLNGTFDALEDELQTVNESLRSLVLSFELMDGSAARVLEENAGPDDRTMLIHYRDNTVKRVTFADNEEDIQVEEMGNFDDFDDLYGVDNLYGDDDLYGNDDLYGDDEIV